MSKFDLNKKELEKLVEIRKKFKVLEELSNELEQQKNQLVVDIIIRLIRSKQYKPLSFLYIENDYIEIV